MSNPTDNQANDSFISRVLRSDSTKKGVAAAAAGILIAIVCESLWPSNS